MSFVLSDVCLRLILLFHCLLTGASRLKRSERGDVDGLDRAPDSTFSKKGRSVIRILKEKWAHADGVQWDYSTDNLLLNDWLVATPVQQIGRPAAELVVPQSCSELSPSSQNNSGVKCDDDFDLIRCIHQDDCIGRGGTCMPVYATTKSPEDDILSLCAGHSAYLYDHMFSLMVRAEHFLDIATLSAMTGRFLAAFRNAITFLHNSGSSVTIRILMAPLASSAKSLLKKLTRDIKGNSSLKIYIGFWRRGFWWNHAKIIAVDGRHVFQGGHNLWDDHYLRASPVHDVSMGVSGSAAVHAHNFLNSMWQSLCRERAVRKASKAVKQTVGIDVAKIVRFPPDLEKCPDAFEPRDQGVDRGDVRIISVARKGGLKRKNGFMGGAADDALYKLFEHAKKSIKCSLQDLGSFGPRPSVSLLLWPKIMKALAKALWNGAHVQLVLSDAYARPNKVTFVEGNYGNGWSLKTIRKAFKYFIWRHKKMNIFKTNRTVNMVLDEQLQLATLRYSDVKDHWKPHSSVTTSEYHNRFANHAKLYIIDDELFYIGSQNLYSADLAEFGFIVDDQEVTKELLRNYWIRLWFHSYGGTPDFDAVKPRAKSA
eukprot:TRINITY_DN30378_c0_g1_i1.p1 TRINITY_DN30378_c0_g1~~TRINITY_DN30378_c0_g1_i1.p1  ORF type:complete len:614 (-),score=68.22 TRINITY_DN30378_c0_g1_i1:259-2046(-)